MIGQWITDFKNDDLDPLASLRIDLEDRGSGCFGHAYLFYPNTDLPGFLYPFSLPKAPPFKTSVRVIYLYPTGGEMTQAERVSADEYLAQTGRTPPPPTMDVEFSLNGEHLKIEWIGGEDRDGSVLLTRSNTDAPSKLSSDPNLSSWNEFRQWAVSQIPRDFIFRGQRKPHKLVSSFHRTWRTDIRAWINDDVRTLFGSMAERLEYPLQIGNLQHNTAFWSILQHHGYPTPMLDWSYSPFVAAYFAFQDADEREDSSPRLYIFDRARWNKKYGRNEFIVDLAPNQLVVIESMSAANPRHTPQQAISTVTNIADVESFVKRREEEDGVVYLTVCDLRLGFRPQIMRELELMGITYGSLFPGLDGICRDIRDRMFAEPDLSV